MSRGGTGLEKGGARGSKRKLVRNLRKKSFARKSGRKRTVLSHHSKAKKEGNRGKLAVACTNMEEGKGGGERGVNSEEGYYEGSEKVHL